MYNKSRVFQAAHFFYRKPGFELSWSMALKLAHAKERMIQTMADHKITFAYIKKSTGEKRIAHGTLNEAIAETKFQFTGTGTPKPHDIITYFDLDKRGWRSFNLQNLVAV